MMIRQQGFNIIEMMVGLTIGLLGLLAVTQVLITFNQARTTTTQTLEAQSNGAMALFLMEHDLTQAGYGLMALKNCQQFQWFWDPPAVAPSVVKPCEPTCGVQVPFTRGVAPVVITTHGANSDELDIQYAQSSSGTPGAQTTASQAAFTDPYKLSSVAGFAKGDLVVADVVAVNGGTGNNDHFCTMSRVTKVNALTDPVTNAALADSSKFTLEHDTVEPVLSDYNAAAGDVTAANTAVGWKAAPIATLVANLGGYISKKYTIANNTLQLGAFPNYATDTDTAADGIVYMKAQYGLDTTPNFADSHGDAKRGDGVVDEWTNSLAHITSGGRVYLNRIIAVRVGIIARSPLFEKNEVDAPDPMTVLPQMLDNGGAPIGVEETYALPDKHYRYKSYYTIVPFRNVIWAP